jgi:hypothetical protein
MGEGFDAKAQSGGQQAGNEPDYSILAAGDILFWLTWSPMCFDELGMDMCSSRLVSRSGILHFPAPFVTLTPGHQVQHRYWEFKRCWYFEGV